LDLVTRPVDPLCEGGLLLDRLEVREAFSARTDPQRLFVGEQLPAELRPISDPWLGIADSASCLVMEDGVL